MSASSRPAIRLLLVDDSELVRRGIQAVFATRAASFLQVVGEAATAAAAVAECDRLRPDVVLLDIRLPDGTGIEACRRIKRAQPRVRVLILSSFLSDDFIRDAIAAGAEGYLTKEIDPEALVRAVSDVAHGKSILDPEAAARVIRLMRTREASPGARTVEALSAQERRVLALVAAGMTNKEIGAQLGLSDNTVKHYLGNVFEKLQVNRRSQAAALYVHSQSPPG